MSVFMPLEREVVRRLTYRHLKSEQLESVLDSAHHVSLETTGVGYFLTVEHPSLPPERRVCSEPAVTGTSGGVCCGFVVFLEGGQLTLECHVWGDESLPDDFRTRRVEITGEAWEAIRPDERARA